MKKENMPDEIGNGFTITTYPHLKQKGQQLSKRIHPANRNDFVEIHLMQAEVQLCVDKNILPVLVIHRKSGNLSDSIQEDSSYSLFAFHTGVKSYFSTLEKMSQIISDELIEKLILLEDIPSHTINFYSWCAAILMDERKKREPLKWGTFAEQLSKPHIIHLYNETWRKKYDRFSDSIDREFKRIDEKEFITFQKQKSDKKSFENKHLEFFFLDQPLRYDLRLLCFRFENHFFKRYISVRLSEKEIHRQVTDYIDNHIQRFVIDASQPNRGDVQSIVIMDKVAYSQSEAYPEGMTFEEYQQLYPTMKLITGAELSKRIEEHKLSITQQPFEEITDEEYYRALGEVPPYKRDSNEKVEFFFLGEALQADLRALYFYCFESETYYTGTRSQILSSEEIFREIEHFINSLKK